MADLQRDGGVPLYLQVADILKKRIFDGDAPTGSSLPAEPELCAQFNVARGTIRQALGKLEAEGFIRREQGRGTFVAWGEHSTAGQELASAQIAFVVPYVRDSFVSTILLGVERAASEHTLSVTFKHVENSRDRQADVLNELIEQRLAGVLLYPVNSEPDPAIDALLAARFPLVLVDRYVRGVRADYVMSDHFGGALRATQHLIELGHRQIGFVSWRDPAISLEHRAAGYERALTEMGLDPDPALRLEVEGYPRVEPAPLRDFLTHHEAMTALVAANDQIALAAYRAARQLGIDIPADLALVGFDNLDVTQHLDVPLTTVEQPAFAIGHSAVTALLQRIEQPTAPPQQIILPTTLIVRASSGEPVQPGAAVAPVRADDDL